MKRAESPPDSGRLVDELCGTTLLQRYRVEAPIASGGMGGVYRGTHVRTGRPVAIKLLARDKDLRRLAVEARAAARLEHPNVVQILDMDEDEAGGVLVMELLEGESLQDRLRNAGTLSPEQCMGLLVPIMGAVARAHDKGILHRDLKPSNIFLAHEPGGGVVPKLLDFGVARIDSEPSLTRDGHIVGTPAYMAPEQVGGKQDLAPSVDVWGMGVVWFECLSGRLPFDGDSGLGTMVSIATGGAPRLGEVMQGCTRGLDNVVDRALARRAAHRFQDMREFARALASTAVWGGLEVSSSPDPVGLPDWDAWADSARALEATADMPAPSLRPPEVSAAEQATPRPVPVPVGEARDGTEPVRPGVPGARSRWAVAALLVLLGLAGWAAAHGASPVDEPEVTGDVEAVQVSAPAPALPSTPVQVTPTADPGPAPSPVRFRSASQALAEEDF